VFESPQRSWTADLNAEQRAAACHGDGPLLVVAGAGSGKTLTLACRVASLIERGVRPERILLLTFSRRAAREMLSRAARACGPEASAKVWGGTFHAVANRLLRLFGRPIGIRSDFTVLDQGDGADLMNLIRSDLGLAQTERRFPRKETLAAVYSRVVNSGTPLPAVVKRHFPWCIDGVDGMREIFGRYTTSKRSQNVLDYDDLLLCWNALARAPETRDRLVAAFDHILVDEYQDTNAVQADILEAMRPPGLRNLTVVGDDAQAIYGFRAATVRNILEFPARFEGAAVVRLERNYRSTSPLLAASNAVIALSPQRHDKTLWSTRPGEGRPVLTTCLDEAEQAELVCRHLLEHREQGVDLKRQAVLFRAAHHSDRLEVELGRRNIPFVKYGGLKFLEAAHVKDVLALLRVLENPRDEVSWFRVLQLLEGVGPAAARRVIAGLGMGAPPATDSDRSPEPEPSGSPLRVLLDAPPTVPAVARPGLDELRSALEDCLDPSVPAASQIARLRRFCEPVFARLYTASASRLRDLEALEQIAAGEPSRAAFLADLTLDPPTSTGDLAGPPLLDEDYVVLSTIHSAKGGEWDVVHVLHASDGSIPSDMATGDDEEIEEERRLLYVALTRARDALYVYVPLRYYRHPKSNLSDKHAYAQVSRFLPEDVRALFDSRIGDAAVADQLPEAATASRGPVAVESYLAALFDG
jgi:DNA helicase-2/ATP-dependent DNA helicase PcrA